MQDNRRSLRGGMKHFRQFEVLFFLLWYFCCEVLGTIVEHYPQQRPAEDVVLPALLYARIRPKPRLSLPLTFRFIPSYAVAVIGGGTGHGEKMVEGPDVTTNFFVEHVCTFLALAAYGINCWVSNVKVCACFRYTQEYSRISSTVVCR